MDAIQPSVAGMFYTADPGALRAEVERYIDAAPAAAPSPAALIAPHAGYRYSGAIAGYAYASLRHLESSVERLVVLGPSHRHAFGGLAVPAASALATPLGTIPVDVAARDRLLQLAQVRADDRAFSGEHCIEVQLPFAQCALGDFSLLPIVVGEASETSVAEVIDAVWSPPESLVVVSTDLSHFHAYEAAQRIDAETAAAIMSGRTDLRPEQACGCRAVNGLLHAANGRGLSATEMARCNSGDTAGPPERVVGYASFLIA